MKGHLGFSYTGLIFFTAAFYSQYHLDKEKAAGIYGRKRK